MVIDNRIQKFQFKLIKRWFYLQLVCLFPFIFFFLVRDFDLIHLIELKTLDARLHLITPRQPHPKIQIITIDEQSQSENGIGPLPWEAYIYQSLIDSISSAQAIALIMRFNREWEVENGKNDQSIDNLFLIRTYIEHNQSTNSLPMVSSWAELPNSFSSLVDQPSFSRHHHGSTDGIYRSAQLVLTEKHSEHYHYALEIHLLCRVLGISINQIQVLHSWWQGYFLQIEATPTPITIPIDVSGRCFFPHFGNHHRYPITSFVDVLKSPHLAANFSDKVVLIGTTSSNQITGQTAVGSVTALGLRANLMNAFLWQSYVWQMTSSITGAYFIIFATILFVMAGWSYYLDQQHLFVIGLFGLLVGHWVLSVLILSMFQVWVNITAISLAILSTGLLTILLLGYLRLRLTLTQLQVTQKQLIRSEKEAAFGIMAARVRHELRNALNLVQAPLEMVRNNFRKGDPLNFSQEPDLIVSEMDSAIIALAKFDRMIDRDLSFFQHKQLELTYCNLKPIIQSAVEATRSLIEASSVQVELECSNNLPAIAIDQNQLQLVLINLIRNACQSMLSGGKLTLSITQNLKPFQLIISIRDTGIGILPQDLNRIFDAFYTTKPKGLGLGLLNAKNIVEAHGGYIEVDSQVGQGTQFTISLDASRQPTVKENE